MRQMLLQEKYPIFLAEIGKHETRHQTVDELVAYFEQCIAAHGKAQFIAVFDHRTHTRGIGGEIDPAIKAAVDVVFRPQSAQPAGTGRTTARHRHRRAGRPLRGELP